MTIYREVQGPKFSDLLPNSHSAKARWESEALNTLITGSGKAAISIVLRYLHKKGTLSTKMDEVLMPKWVGYWVYNQVNEFARPVFSAHEKLKVIMPYHQYGFPQKMDEIQEYANSIGAVIIEDRAHALWMGDGYSGARSKCNFEIYSFSKYFHSFALGAVSSEDEDFKNFARKQIKASSGVTTFFNNAVKILSELDCEGYLPQSKLWHNLVQMSYSLYGVGLKPSQHSIGLMRAKIDNEILCRRQRYAYFKSFFKDLNVEEYLGDFELAPYVIPLHLPLEKLEKMSLMLNQVGFKTGIYHFDMNRNILNSNFKKTLWILLHGGIDDGAFQNQLDIIKKGI